MNSVEVVIVNYKRPNNIGPILAQFKNQNCKKTLVDCHPSPAFAVADSVLKDFDQIVRLTENKGAFNRYVPSDLYKCEYTYFHDDDMLPGLKVIDYFLNCAAKTPFGVLGQFGRILPLRCHPYSPKDVPRNTDFVEVDMIVRGYFVKTTNIVNVFKMNSNFEPPECYEDDLMLSCGMHLFSRLKNYLIPLSKDIEESICIKELDDTHAFCSRNNHSQMRNHTIRQMYDLGWSGILDKERKK